MKFITIIAGLFFIAGAAYAVSTVTEPQNRTYSWRYKMTVEIDTPEGVKTGSAVREVTVTFEPNLAEKSGYYARKTMKGEAVVVDLGKRGKMFATLGAAGTDSSLPFYVFEGPPGLTLKGAEYYSKLKNQKAILTPTHYPQLISFKDLNEPKSVVRLLEKETDGKHPLTYTVKSDYFSKYLGDEVKLKNIIIETTEEPVEYTIKKTIPWLGNFPNGRLDGNRFGTIEAKNRLLNSLSAGSFTTKI